jgi:inorganic triphosphatase YgiF
MEIELKFQVPMTHHAALARAMAGPGSRQLRLRAQYFDTAERALARAGLALRVRREGRRWVQTLKGAGDGLFRRLEHEAVVVAPAGVVPAADPARHDGTPAGDALRRALGDAPLVPTYGTDITRRLRLLTDGPQQVEVALDRGHLLGGGRTSPVYEIEFELKQGDAAALLAIAGDWAQRHGLTLDLRTKAERGDRLTRGRVAGPARKAEALALPAQPEASAALRAIVGNCLRQILGNASEVAHGPFEPEHIHQLRVGLRRLRSALRELGSLSPQADPAWAEPLEALFRRLGAARDRDALAQRLLPSLRGAGAQSLVLPTADDAVPPPQLLAEVRTTQLWLALLGFAAGPGLGGGPFAPKAAERLAALHRQVRRDAARFDALDDAGRHRLRKRLKRLRYLCEFAAPCFRGKAVRAYLKRVAPAQEALGEFNDVCVARALLQPLADGGDAQAAFALGWLAHEHADAIARCRAPLAALRKAEPFW